MTGNTDVPSDAYVDVQLKDEHFHLYYIDPEFDGEFVDAAEEEELSKQAHEYYLDDLFKCVPIQKGDTILDLGCGTGMTATWLAKKFGCVVYGVDIVEKNISVAKERVKQEKLENLVHMQQGDAAEIDFPSEKFNHVISVETLYHIEDKIKLFSKVGEILKPGGYLAFSDYTLERPCSQLLESTVQDLIESKFFVSVNEYRDILTNTGFMNVREENVSQYTIEKLIEVERKRGFQGFKDIYPNSFIHRIMVTLFAPIIARIVYKGAKKEKFRLNFIAYKKL